MQSRSSMGSEVRTELRSSSTVVHVPLLSRRRVGRAVVGWQGSTEVSVVSGMDPTPLWPLAPATVRRALELSSEDGLEAPMWSMDSGSHACMRLAAGIRAGEVSERGFGGVASAA